MKSKLLFVVTMIFVGLQAHAESRFECLVWQPDQDVKMVEATSAESLRYTLVENYHLQISVQQGNELSLALFDSKSKNLITVARGTGNTTLSHMSPRVIANCTKD